MGDVKALLWDVDGTLAETERDGHLAAFNLAFEAARVPWRWDEARYAELLHITGGRERLLHDMQARPDAPASVEARNALAGALHLKKNALYAELAQGGRIALRAGVAALMQQCRERGVRMGIATTTSRSNIDALLRVHFGERWAERFDVVLGGEDVQRKKPDPEVYALALRALGLGPLDVVAIEDSPPGAAAARAAGIAVIVTRSVFFADATIEGALAIGPGLNERHGWQPAPRRTAADGEPVGLDDIEDWLAQCRTPVPAR